MRALAADLIFISFTLTLWSALLFASDLQRLEFDFPEVAGLVVVVNAAYGRILTRSRWAIVGIVIGGLCGGVLGLGVVFSIAFASLPNDSPVECWTTSLLYAGYAGGTLIAVNIVRQVAIARNKAKRRQELRSKHSAN